MRSQRAIDEEIFALKALKPVEFYRRSTQTKINLAIEELEDGVDSTTAEWAEMDDSEQDVVLETRRWAAGDSEKCPSQGWGRLVL